MSWWAWVLVIAVADVVLVLGMVGFLTRLFLGGAELERKLEQTERRADRSYMRTELVGGPFDGQHAITAVHDATTAGKPLILGTPTAPAGGQPPRRAVWDDRLEWYVVEGTEAPS